jgi:hypothetical protein
MVQGEPYEQTITEQVSPGRRRRGKSTHPPRTRARPRRDGWTVEKQIAFIEALAETGIVEEACRRVGMSRSSADNLRRRPCGVHFRRAWEAALDYSLYRVEEDASIVISVWSRDPPFLLEPTKAGRPRIKSGVTGAR